jgi:hypothetical protein
MICDAGSPLKTAPAARKILSGRPAESRVLLGSAQEKVKRARLGFAWPSTVLNVPPM